MSPSGSAGEILPLSPPSSYFANCKADAVIYANGKPLLPSDYVLCMVLGPFLKARFARLFRRKGIRFALHINTNRPTTSLNKADA